MNQNCLNSTLSYAKNNFVLGAHFHPKPQMNPISQSSYAYIAPCSRFVCQYFLPGGWGSLVLCGGCLGRAPLPIKLETFDRPENYFITPTRSRIFAQRIEDINQLL